MYIKTFNNKKPFISTAIKFIFDNLKNKKNYIALSGGNTPKEIYQALDKKLKSAKKQIEFFQVDERCVPATSPDSNQRMIRKSFASPNSSIRFHFFDTSISIRKSFKKYSKELPKSADGKIKPFNLTILGIGTDGHIASLFPAKEKTANFKALATHSSVARTTTKKFAIKKRLTLTFQPILKSKKILILLKGKEKLRIIKKLQDFQDSKITQAEIQKFPALKLLTHKKIQINFLNN